ncbi:MAG TPA: sigma 54-interacting transcriptional regulator [Polyangiaceae bacterium]|nr:sigma 54-interacting transcriptional regulator [Polyangiaceae bacterium]
MTLKPPSGPTATRTLREGDKVVVGSAPPADLTVREATISRRHAVIRHSGGFIEVTDLDSTNGLTLDGARVGAARLGLGGALLAGRVALTVRAASACDPSAGLPGLVGSSPPMLELAARVRRFAPLSLSVLVRGESGTGKDLVARAVHRLSKRRGAFVALNAATITRELAESELFGHRRGAFTGAHQDRRGAFREADGGTLFIDEVAALPLDVQAKLLRVVEERSVRPVGAEGPIAVDVRIVAATCEPLEARISAGLFRDDLYERLAACIVRVPPLSQRASDIGEIARHLLEAMDLGAMRLGDDAIRELESRRYRGNVRELRSLLTHAALAAREDGSVLGAQHVRAAAVERHGAPPTPVDARRLVEDARGNVSLAARRAGIPRSTLRDLLARDAVR